MTLLQVDQTFAATQVQTTQVKVPLSQTQLAVSAQQNPALYAKIIKAYRAGPSASRDAARISCAQPVEHGLSGLGKSRSASAGRSWKSAESNHAWSQSICDTDVVL
jgi:hypothetical protein